MKIAEAHKRLATLENTPFCQIFSPAELKSIVKNKGKTGQLLELALGMHLSNRNLDFEDGELKTNKCKADATPVETIFITQISSCMDELLQQKPFETTHLFEKISNMLYVPVCKEGTPQNWMFLPSIHIDLSKPEFAPLYAIWENDYYSICHHDVMYRGWITPKNITS